MCPMAVHLRLLSEHSSTYGHRDGNQAITDQGFISLDTQVHTHSCIISGQTDTNV